MPVIPGAQPSQVLNAGSPVPIASPEEARAAGNALSGLGQGMFALGDALDTAAAKEREKKDRLSAQMAENEAMRVILEEKARSQQAGPIQGDQTGFGQAQGFYDRVQSRINEIADRIDNPETKKMFLAGIGPETNRSANEVYAQEIVKRKNQNQVLQDQVISGYAQTARFFPQEIENVLGQTELSIRGNTDIQPAVMEEAVAAGKRQVLEGAINGQVADKNYASAEVLLEKYSGGIFTPDVKEKMLDNIRTEQYKEDTRQLNALNLQEKRAEKSQKEVEKKTMDYYFSALQLAGVDESKRAPVVLQIGQDVIKGKISQEKANALIGSKIFNAPTDDNYDATVMRKLFKDDDFNGAIDKIYADRGIKVSPERASDMINRISAIQDRQRNDPNFVALMKAGEKKIRDQAADTILAPMDNFSKRELLTKVDQTVEMYYKQVMKNPKIDTVALSNNLIDTNLGFRTKYLKGQENFMNFDSIQGIDKEKARILKEAVIEKNSGRMTPAKERQVREQLNILEQQAIKLRNKKQISEQSTSAAPSGGTTRSAPAGGR